MRMYDIITKKRSGGELTREEIRFFVKGAAEGGVDDSQLTALLMAIWFNGMTDAEAADLTLEMAFSGDTVDLSGVNGVTVDKHSSGGVGDKTTLIVAPIVAACGGKVAKMSGRGLGHTGGTVDKLESIPGFNVSLSPERFVACVNENGLAVVGQTGNLAPADKKLYALRDVTATVDSIPLIASSIMSKKIAAGCGRIVLDVKVGDGAFMKTVDDAERLARLMVSIGNSVGRKTSALLTNMNVPLGLTVGNTLEVIEAVEVLRGGGANDLVSVSLELAANMLELCGFGSTAACRETAKNAVTSGAAFEKLCSMVSAQGGNADYLLDTSLFPQAKCSEELLADDDCFISSMQAEKIGTAACMLGAGRKRKDDKIDFSAGIRLIKKPGDKLKKGEPFAVLYTNDSEKLIEARSLVLSAVTLSDAKPEPEPLIYKIVK